MLYKPVVETSRRRALSVPPDAQLERVRAVFRAYGVRVVAVVQGSRLLGVISRADVIRVTATKTEALARDVASAPRATLSPSTTVAEALEKLLSLGEWYLPVVSEGDFLGFFGLEDAIEACLSSAECSRRLEGLRVEEVMVEDYPRVLATDPLSSVWRLLTEEGYVSVPVVDEKNRIVGIVTQFDLIKKGYTRIHVESPSGPAKRPRVRSAMTRPCTYVYPHTTVREAGALLVTRNIAGAPVARDDASRAMVGFVSRLEVAKSIL
ncbi:MAG: CBS domain-containing protein [Acidilobaceae archaeon]